MKKTLFSILVTLLGLNATAFAKDVSTANGSSHLNGGEYDSLEVNGSLMFKDLFVKDTIVVNGSIQGKNLKCYRLESNGSVDVDGLLAQGVEINGSFSGQNIDIAGDAEFNGSFSGQNIDIAGDAEFNGGVEVKNGKLHDIQIKSITSTITDSQVNGNICIKKVNKGPSFFGFKSNESSTQILELKGCSIVSGNVVFQKNGEVHLFDRAKVEGEIIKAKVIKK